MREDDDGAEETEEEEKGRGQDKQITEKGNAKFKLASDNVAGFWQKLFLDQIGVQSVIRTPFGERNVVFADYIASARAVRSIETFISKEVLPLYANTHTTASATGMQSTLFRAEARSIVRRCVGCDNNKDSLIFTGTGCTGAVVKMVELLRSSEMWRECMKAGQRPLVVVGPYEHHSNLLPWRETGSEIIVVREQEEGGVDLAHLEQVLSLHKERKVKIGSFSAASNITGILVDTVQVAITLHKHGALAFFDFATAGPYCPVNMNPPAFGEDAHLAHKDAIFLSPHKFVGGVSSPGVLAFKKSLLGKGFIFGGGARPSVPGGGTVFFVTEHDHRYLENLEEREEGGTPDVVGSIRCGLAMRLKEFVGAERIMEEEEKLWRRALQALEQQPELEVLGKVKAARLPVVSFNVRHGGKLLHFNFVSALLNDLFGIQARSGCSCAGPYAQRLLGIDFLLAKEYEHALLLGDELLRPGFVRLNFAFFLPEFVVDYMLQALLWVAREGWRMLPLYTFNASTGEWRHRSERKFMLRHRKWMSDVSFSQDKSSRSAGDAGGEEEEEEEDGTFLERLEANFKRNMEMAEEVVRKIEEAARGGKPVGPTMVTDSQLAGEEKAIGSPDAARLRWFLLPSEALAELRGKEAAPASHPSSAFVPEGHEPCGMDEEAVEEELLARQPHSTTEDMLRVLGERWRAMPKDEEHKEEETKGEENKRKGEGKGKEGKGRVGGGKEVEKQMSSGKVAEGKGEDEVSMHKRAQKAEKKLMSSVGKAIQDFGMIKDGDRVLVGLSGGKDSLSLLHILLALKRKAPIKFDVAACTVDPQTPEYDPSTLKTYLQELNVAYFYESHGIIQQASCSLQKNSICSFCSRMKRGVLYSVCEREGFNVLALGQHLDDQAESFLMSAFHNGQLRTMKANYLAREHAVRIIRPLTYVREQVTREFAMAKKLPVINENCPGCFEAPQERARIKMVLAAQEQIFPDLYGKLGKALLPLMAAESSTRPRER
ncbi:hypothetical protein GUITHDRAFT_158402 [Guillardia theta CCMP2712]|uniref:Aminotransferase class V domain-containing protein n=4 Tax=Guillardia theta TaxID=55529 RepID=L1IU52_GUITC|nr:hypothetical protein GUITHDRAFT_158402 [Guillardia theta CCMP2712]EKX39424.1 hypothetical protein GUITHDRAFT_158402 [Guillardia theta CCMP2712]|eukprot:XP_005826404.1 hypothetical protein GUITHDRAFT_158402 [Guillardia theta CCMP2712]